MSSEPARPSRPSPPSPSSSASPSSPSASEERRLWDAVTGLALLAGGANVIMQLSQLPIGHGVAESRVDSGRIDKHPIKRTRTTLSYLMIAIFGTDDERDAMRREVNRSHRDVSSRPDDPVAYNAFDVDLQLWVAACLYRGIEDVVELMFGSQSADLAPLLYARASRLATTLQVPEQMWPVDRAAFAAYWDEKVKHIEMDATTRRFLRRLARLQVLPAPIPQVLGPAHELITMGFLPPEFRAELGVQWDGRRQRIFDTAIAGVAAVNRRLPRVARAFPLNYYLWDARNRIKAGRPIV